MSKTFFQDMIKMKEDLRKDMPKKIASEMVKQEKKEEKKEIKIIKEVSVPKPIEKREVSRVSEDLKADPWSPPTVEPKVSRRVELSDEDASPRRPRYYLWVVAVASVVFLFFAVSFLFSEALVSINPKTQQVTLSQSFSSSKDSTGDTLPFDLVVLSGEESRTVEGGAVKDVALSAKGTTVIYNAFSSATQKLDIDTRLEGSNGKIYKTEKAIVVPGMKGTTPGSIEVGIYGSEAGEAYNSDPLDFKIFGFKGTSKYTKFYGRSKGSITGGFKGKSNLVSDADKTNATSEMKAILLAKLSKKAADQIPDGVILFKDANFLNIESVTYGEAVSGSTSVPVTMKGTFYGFLFNENELTQKIVTTALPGYDGSEVFISNISDLVFSLSNKDSTGSDVKNISFNISGKPNIVWKFDSGKLAASLVDKSKSDFNTILASYPNIDSANLVLRPFWKRSFPGDAESIKVTVNYPN